MRFEAEVGGKALQIEVETSGARLRVRLDGRDVAADASWISARELSLLVDGKSYEIEVWPIDRDRVDVAVGGRLLAVRFGGASGIGRARETETRRGDERVAAPMPGKVVAVLVAPGDAVVAGTGLVVVEAMKMENELVAGTHGVVRAVHVQVGQVVEEGTALVEIGAREEAS